MSITGIISAALFLESTNGFYLPSIIIILLADKLGLALALVYLLSIYTGHAFSWLPNTLFIEYFVTPVLFGFFVSRGVTFAVARKLNAI